MGGTGAGSFSNGSVPFSNGTTFAQDNSSFFWDNTDKRLGIGTSSPSGQLHLGGSGQTITNNFGLLIDDKTTGTNNFNIWSGPPLTAFDSQIQADIAEAAPTLGVNVFTSVNRPDHGDQTTFFLSQGGDTSNAIAATSYNTGEIESGQTYAISAIGISIAPAGQGTRIVTGGYFRGDNKGTGNISDLSGIFVDSNRIASDGTVESNAGIHILPQSGAQNNYGLLIDSGTGYSLYTSGDAKSYFGGNIGIKTQNPDTSLDVVGSIKGDSTIILGNSTTPACIEAADSDGNGVSYITVNDGVISASDTKPSFCQ